MKLIKLNNRIKHTIIALLVFLSAIVGYNYFFPLGKYVYIEAFNTEMRECDVCHIKGDCSKITGTVKRIESEQLGSINTSGWSFCPRCVNDRAYEMISE